MWRAVRLGYEVYNATGQINVHILTPDAVLIQPGSEVTKACFTGARGPFAADTNSKKSSVISVSNRRS